MLNYEKIRKMIDDLPMTMLAGMFTHTAEQAWRKGCFRPGGMANVCSNIEERFPREPEEVDMSPIRLTCSECLTTIIGTVEHIHLCQSLP